MSERKRYMRDTVLDLGSFIYKRDLDVQQR